MTRMGLHVHAHLGWDEAVEYCRVVKPAIMKWLSPSRQVLERCRAVSPGTKHVFRPYWSDQQLGGKHDEFVRFSQDAVREFGGLINWYEGYNEFACDNAQVLSNFVSAELGRAKKLNDMGVGVAMGGFSTGAFDTGGKAYDAVRPMLEFLHRTGPHNVWHSHEYSGPYMGYMVRTPDGRNQWTRTPSNPGGSFSGWSTDGTQYWQPGLDGWLTLRYRMLRKRLEADGLTGVRMIFTECGIDDVNPRPGGANRKGWRDYAGSEWTQIPGMGDYAAQLHWYGWQLSHDPYVLGWCDFGWGSEDPAWWSFSLDKTPDMLRRVIETQQTLPIGATGGAPVADKLADMLRAEFGTAFDDLRGSLETNTQGPAGDFGPLDPANVEALVLHHTAGGYETSWQSVARYHVESRGFAGIGYHLGIQHGRVSYLGDVGTARAHVANANHRYVGIVVAGNYQTDTPKPADLALLSRLGTVLRAYFGRPLPWKGHRDVAPPGYTVCPGTSLYATLGAPLPPADDFNVDGLKRAAILYHDETGIRVNPDAALFKHAQSKGLHVVTNEAGYGVDQVPFVVAESYGADRRKVVIWWRNGRVGEADL